MRPMQVGAGRRGPSFDEGSLDQYLREISKYPLIPQEEEVTLAQRIRTNMQQPPAIEFYSGYVVAGQQPIFGVIVTELISGFVFERHG